MGKLYLKRNKIGIYKQPFIPNEDLVLDTISTLFVDGADFEYIVEGLFDKSILSISGNRFYLHKQGGDNLKVGDLYDDNGELEVDFSKKTLLKLLDQWLDLVAKKTEIIVFYRNGDDYGMVDAQDFHEA